MERDLPPFVLAERQAIRQEIITAFAGVSRRGGVSWSETKVKDLWGSLDEEAAARKKDSDSQWTDLLRNPEQIEFNGLGGWVFLDAIGFRYYLPAAMIICMESDLYIGLDLQSDGSQQWGILDMPQKRSVKRFLEYMCVLDPDGGWKNNYSPWRYALDRYWSKIPAEGEMVEESPAGKKKRRKNRA